MERFGRNPLILSHPEFPCLVAVSFDDATAIPCLAVAARSGLLRKWQDSPFL
jgi:hypothetical protein